MLCFTRPDSDADADANRNPGEPQPQLPQTPDETPCPVWEFDADGNLRRAARE